MSDKFSQIKVSEIENFLEQIFANQRYEKNFAKFSFVIHGFKTNFAEFIFEFLLFTFTLGDLYDWAFFNQLYNTSTIET